MEGVLVVGGGTAEVPWSKVPSLDQRCILPSPICWDCLQHLPHDPERDEEGKKGFRTQ